MKLTQRQLKQIIRQEAAKLMESADLNTGLSGMGGDDDDKTYMGHVKTDALEEETADHREDKNIDHLWAEVRKMRAELDAMKKD